jgi:lysozyme
MTLHLLETLQPSDKCYTLIRQFETFSAVPRECAAGYYTIGYGHVITAHEEFMGQISETYGEKLLIHDVQYAAEAVHRLIPIPFTQGQLDALTSFTFHLGVEILQRSVLRRVVARGELERVPTEFRRWVHAGSGGIAASTQRREAEIILFMGKSTIESTISKDKYG